eukprot:569152-Ditylum_brightwellii.AAC.1
MAHHDKLAEWSSIASTRSQTGQLQNSRIVLMGNMLADDGAWRIRKNTSDSPLSAPPICPHKQY